MTQSKNSAAAGIVSAFLLVLSSSAAIVSTDSKWFIHVWQSDQGLPNNKVTGIAQTADGFLWIATPTGVVRFDGSRFDKIPRETFAPGTRQRTSAVLGDPDGGLWFAMDYGPVIYARAGVIRTFTNHLPSDIVEQMLEDKNHALWVVYRGGTVLRLKKGHSRIYRAAGGLPGYSPCSLALDRNGQLWFAKGGNVGRFQHGRFAALLHLGSQTTVIRLAPSSQGGLWICAGSTLFRLTGGRQPVEIAKYPSATSSDHPTALLEDSEGGVWIGASSSGLFRFRNGHFEEMPVSHRDILALMQDNEGDIWAGTAGGGLDRIEPRAITLANNESLSSVCQDANGTLWAVAQNGSLVCRSNGIWTTISLASNWPGGSASCVTCGPDGAIWIGTANSSLLRLDHGQFTAWRISNGLKSRKIHALLADANGDLWIGGNDPPALQRLRGGQFHELNLPPNSGFIRALARDSKGVVWAGSTKGLLLRISNNIIMNESPQLDASNSIRTLCATPDGSLWIGYAGWGLGRLKDGQLSKITSARGLYDDYISQIAPDRYGWLWFGGNRGIFKVRQHALDTAMDHPGYSVQSLHYGVSEGFAGLQANFDDCPNSWRASDGKLWFPMSLGLAVVDPARLPENPRPPPVLLERVSVDDVMAAAYGSVLPVIKGMNLQKAGLRLRLPPGHHRLQFDFTALCLRAPENLAFQYRLKNLDDQWIDAGALRSAIYPRLAAGQYLFQVRGRNGDGPWSKADAGIAFSVAPFFWQTWWFRAASLALFTALVFAGARYISFRRLQTKVRRLEQLAVLNNERSRIARDIHDQLGGTLTQITLQLELALRHLVTPAKAGRHVHQSLDGARKVIKSLDETVWAVNPGNDNLPHLVNYIGEYAVEFLDSAGIRCRLDLPAQSPERSISAEARHNLFLAAKEALNNIVRHADASEVRIAANVTNGSLVLTVQDNGRGCNGIQPHSGADGLGNMRQRMEAIGGKFRIENPAGGGTKVFFIYPWHHGN